MPNRDTLVDAQSVRRFALAINCPVNLIDFYLRSSWIALFGCLINSTIPPNIACGICTLMFNLVSLTALGRLIASLSVCDTIQTRYSWRRPHLDPYC